MTLLEDFKQQSRDYICLLERQQCGAWIGGRPGIRQRPARRLLQCSVRVTRAPATAVMVAMV